MGLTEQMLGSDFHLPELQIVTAEVPVSVKSDDPGATGESDGQQICPRPVQRSP